jgi:hypothetical protein
VDKTWTETTKAADNSIVISGLSFKMVPKGGRKIFFNVKGMLRFQQLNRVPC